MRKKSTSAFGRSCAASRALGTRCVAAAALALPFGLTGGAAHAFEIRTDNPDLKLRWDNTFKYSNAFRVKSQSERLLQDVNLDDGDRNFDKGLISNRLDLLSEVDVGWKSLGFRASGAAWYDSVYNRRNDHDSPASANSTSVGYNRFTDATRELHGRKAEVLDFFAFGKTDLGSMPLTVRLGRHTLIYGESLFFGSNGIAAAQGPVDLVKLLTVPSSQFKEILRPVEQVSGVLQINSQMTLGAYYQFKFRESIIRPPAATSAPSTSSATAPSASSSARRSRPAVARRRSGAAPMSRPAIRGRAACSSAGPRRAANGSSASTPRATTTRGRRCTSRRLPRPMW
ncbi:hypothetical protein X551_03143 [Methylibium sp. T29]|nr:hypothetical protein X551_03143 [Methylibium sp. T29]